MATPLLRPDPYTDPEDRPNDPERREEVMKQTAAGMAAVGMTYTGLNSFGEWGKLFGTYGEAAARPFEAVRDYIDYAKGILRKGDLSAETEARAALASEAERRSQRNQKAQAFASENIDRENRVKSYARVYAKAQREAGVVRMADAIARRNEDDVAPGRLPEMDVDFGFNDELPAMGPATPERPRTRYGGVSNAQRALLLTARAEARQLLPEAEWDARRNPTEDLPLQEEVDRLRSRARQYMDPDFAISDRILSQGRTTSRGDVTGNIPTNFELLQEQETGKPAPYPAFDEVLDTHHPLQDTGVIESAGQGWFQDEEEARNAVIRKGHYADRVTAEIRGARRVMVQRAEEAYKQQVSTRDLQDEELRRAYADWYTVTKQKGATPPEQMSVEAIRLRAQMDGSFGQFARDHTRQPRGSQQRKGSKGRIITGNAADNVDQGRVRPRQAQGPVNFVDPMAGDVMQGINPEAMGGTLSDGTKISEFYDHDRSGTISRSGRRSWLVNSTSTSDQLARSVTDQLIEGIEQLNKKQDGPRFDLDVRKIDIDANHQSYQFQIRRGGEVLGNANVPLPSEKGSYKLRADQASFFHPATKLQNSDLFKDTEPMTILRAQRKNLVARPDEIALMNMHSFTEKLLADLRGGRGASAVKRLHSYAVERHYEQKSTATDSPEQNALKAREQRSSTEMLYRELSGDRTRRQEYQKGLDSMRRLRNLFESGQNYFSADTEFVSRDMRMERGVSGRAKVPFEIAGSIMNPEKDTAEASILYRADLRELDGMTGAEKSALEKHRNAVREIYRDIGGLSEEKTESLMNIMKGGGQLEMTVDGEKFDLLSENGKKPDWVPNRREGEKLGKYYLRVQNATMNKKDAKFSVGQNYGPSEGTVFDLLAEKHGVNLHHAHKANTIDTLNIAKVLTANPQNSLGLSSIMDTVYGIGNLKERRQVKEQFELYGEQRAAGKIKPDAIDPFKNRLNTEGQKKLFDDLAKSIPQGSDTNFHSASFDEMVTSRVVMPRLYEFSKTMNGQKALDRSRDALDFINDFVGRRKYADRHSSLDRGGGLNEDNEMNSGLNPFVQNATSASFGRGVVFGQNYMPFQRLQNPVRQLYQRQKYKKLMNKNPIASADMVDMGRGKSMQRRGRGPGQDMLEKLRYKEEMGKSKDVNEIMNQAYGTRSFGEGVAVDARDRDAPAIFAGFGSATTGRRNLYGGYENEASVGVTSRVAYVPEESLRGWESQMHVTAARREAMRTKGQVKSESIRLETKDIDIDEMNKSIQEMVDEIGGDQKSDMRKMVTTITDHKEILDTQSGTNVDTNLRQAYVIKRLLDDSKSNTKVSNEARKTMEFALDQRLQRAQGQGMSREEIIQNRFDALMKGEAGNMGGRQPVIRGMREGAMVLEEMKSPSNSELLGLDVQFRQQSDRPGEMMFDFLEPMPDTFKEVAMGAKMSAAGTLRNMQAGMAGEQAIMPADMFKQKRRDFASAIHVQIGRLHDEAVAKMSGVQSSQHRQKILDRFVDALHEMTGKSMSRSQIRDEVVKETLGGQKFADYFEIDMTPAFTKAIEENATTTSIMSANKKMGRSMADVFRHGSAMVQARDNVSQTVAEKRVANVLKRQVSNEIQSIKGVGDTSIAQQVDGGLIGNGPKGQKRKQEIDKALKVLYKQEEALNELFDGSIRSNQALSDLSQHGSLWDIFTDSEDDTVMTAFRALAPSGMMQGSAVGGTGMGDVFEAGSGRATLSKRSSMMTAALIGHSGSATLGGLGRREQMANEMFKGWVAAQSGAAAFADSKIQRQVFEQLQANGVKAKDVYDPARIKRVEDDATGKTRVMYERKDDSTVTLSQHLQDKFSWNDDGTLMYTPEHGEGTPIQLKGVNPYTNRLETQRRQGAVLGMVTGNLATTAGNNAGGGQAGKDRVLRVVFGEETDINKGRINAKDFHKLFGQETRAKQYYQHEEGAVPDDMASQRSYDSKYVYFGQDARPAGFDPEVDANYQNTIFNQDFDYIVMDLDGGADQQQSRVIREMMTEAGVSEETLNRVFLGGEESVVQQVMQGERSKQDPMSERQVRNMVRTAQKMHGDSGSQGAKVILPTRTGALAPTEDVRGKGPDGQRVKRANVQAAAELADLLGELPGSNTGAPSPIEQLNQSVQAIHREAEAIRQAESQARGEEVSLEDALATEKGKRRMKHMIRKQVQNDVTSHNLIEAEDMYGTMLRQSATLMVKQMEDLDGTYLGGEFKISSTQVRFENDFAALARASDASADIGEGAVKQLIKDGPNDAFTAEVRSMMRRHRPQEVGTEKFKKKTTAAADDLYKYVVQQQADFGEDVHRWRGMGVDEGFVSRENARKATQNMIAQQEGFDRLDMKTTSKSDRADRRALDEMKEFAEGAKREVNMAKQELARPGSTLGLLFGTARFPDFQNLGGFGMSRMSVLGGDAMRALGADPNHIHAFTHPLSAEMRYEDFDYDLNYLFAIDDAHAAATIRETRATQETNNLMNIHRLLEEVRNPELFGLEGGNIDAISEETDTVTVRGETVSAQRLTSPFGGDDTFGDNVLSFFASKGMALDAVQREDLATKNYALQKAIVGQMGAYAKQGALNTRIQGNAFTDAMTRLVKQEERMVEEEMKQRMGGQDMSTAARKRMKQEVEGDVSSYFDSIFGKGEEQQGSTWEGMKSTYNRYGEMLERGGFMGNDMHAVAITDTLITENIAIYKYKSGRAESMSAHVNNIMQTLHGNHSGGFESFDEAFDALMDDPDVRENTMVKVERLFGDYDGDAEEKIERAREAYRLRYDKERAMRSIAGVGIEDTYKTRAANINPSDVDITSAIAMGSKDLMRGNTAAHLHSKTVDAVAESLDGTALQQNMQEFFATSSWHTQNLADITPRNNVSANMKNLADHLPNARSMAAVGAAAVAVTALVGAAKDGTDIGQQQDQRRPSYAVQGRSMGRGFAQRRQHAADNTSWATRRQPAGGISAAAARPPSVRSTY